MSDIKQVVDKILEGNSVRDTLSNAVLEKNANWVGDLKVGQKVIWHTDDGIDGKHAYPGTVKSVHPDHVIVDVPQVSDHCWIDSSCIEDLEIVD